MAPISVEVFQKYWDKAEGLEKTETFDEPTGTYVFEETKTESEPMISVDAAHFNEWVGEDGSKFVGMRSKESLEGAENQAFGMYRSMDPSGNISEETLKAQLSHGLSRDITAEKVTISLYSNNENVAYLEFDMECNYIFRADPGRHFVDIMDDLGLPGLNGYEHSYMGPFDEDQCREVYSEILPGLYVKSPLNEDENYAPLEECYEKCPKLTVEDYQKYWELAEKLVPDGEESHPNGFQMFTVDEEADASLPMVNCETSEMDFALTKNHSHEEWWGKDDGMYIVGMRLKHTYEANGIVRETCMGEYGLQVLEGTYKEGEPHGLQRVFTGQGVRYSLFKDGEVVSDVKYDGEFNAVEDEEGVKKDAENYDPSCFLQEILEGLPIPEKEDPEAPEEPSVEELTEKLDEILAENPGNKIGTKQRQFWNKIKKPDVAEFQRCWDEAEKWIASYSGDGMNLEPAGDEDQGPMINTEIAQLIYSQERDSGRGRGMFLKEMDGQEAGTEHGIVRFYTPCDESPPADIRQISWKNGIEHGLKFVLGYEDGQVCCCFQLCIRGAFAATWLFNDKWEVVRQDDPCKLFENLGYNSVDDFKLNRQEGRQPRARPAKKARKQRAKKQPARRENGRVVRQPPMQQHDPNQGYQQQHGQSGYQQSGYGQQQYGQQPHPIQAEPVVETEVVCCTMF